MPKTYRERLDEQWRALTKSPMPIGFHSQVREDKFHRIQQPCCSCGTERGNHPESHYDVPIGIQQHYRLSVFGVYCRHHLYDRELGTRTYILHNSYILEEFRYRLQELQFLVAYVAWYALEVWLSYSSLNSQGNFFSNVPDSSHGTFLTRLKPSHVHGANGTRLYV